MNEQWIMTFKSIYRQLHTARNLDFCSKIQIFFTNLYFKRFQNSLSIWKQKIHFWLKIKVWTKKMRFGTVCSEVVRKPKKILIRMDINLTVWCASHITRVTALLQLYLLNICAKFTPNHEFLERSCLKRLWKKFRKTPMTPCVNAWSCPVL